LPEWIDLDTAVARARSRGATDEHFNEILRGRFPERRIDVTACLESAPIERVRENFPALAAQLNVMLSWRAPQYVQEFLARASSVECLPGNRLRVTIYWGLAARSLHADTCILCDVHVFWPQLDAELEASGFPEGAATDARRSDQVMAQSPRATEPPSSLTPAQTQAFVDWSEADKEKLGSYPPMQKSRDKPRDRESVREYARRVGIPREQAEALARSRGWVKRGRRPKKQTSSD